MVFKRVLKGIGRLMLTTAVMCGVGLFLCSSEVKAAAPSSPNGDEKVYINEVGDNYEIVIDAPASTNYTTIENPKILLNSKQVVDSGFTIMTGTIENTTGAPKILKLAEIAKSAVDNALMEKISDNTLTETTDFTVGSSVDLKAEITVGSTKKTSEDHIESKPIYKVDVTKFNTGVTFAPTFSYTVGGRNMQYGYEGESYEVMPSQTDYDLNNYFDLVKESNSFSLDPKDTAWRPANTISGTIKSTQSENVFKVAYLPKIEELKIADPTNGRLDITTSGVAPVSSTVKYQIGRIAGDKETSFTDLTNYKLVASTPSSTNLGSLEATTVGQSVGNCKVTMSLSSTDTSGSGTASISAILGNHTVCSVDLPVSLSIKATGFELNSTTVSIMAGESRDVPIIKGILPAGANQTLSNYDGIATVTSGADLINTPTYAAGKLTLKTKSGVTSGTATVKITLTDNTTSTDLDPQTLTVKIISFDKEKTISSINKNNKNYITYNKDKGYSLDIKQLIIDNAKDTSDNTVTITKDQIINVSVGGSLCTDGIWKPSEAALNKKVTCKINGTEISSDNFTVSAYPMPTATYSSSNRTLSVKIPTKVATSYSDDNNIRQSKGFKLILEDSSGNTLYEYTDSKYQNVLSSSSESTVTYTVPAADIEGMVTSAASNGKFSADTTSVKFKVIPMGYKQSSTSDETIKAKDEIAGKTDAVTVYKVSASGTNFTSSAAYGLDGQTVSITATPNSGYSFKQWSDGNTSNPRQVKVSASGTRAFQAVAGDRVANSTGAGGTDNSELYDDVPKTAESNSAIWLIVFMVFAVMGTTYALYLQLRAANSKHDR